MAVRPVDWTLSSADKPIAKWETIAQNDTCAQIAVQPSFLKGEGVLVVSGVMTTATVGLEGSHDGVIWADVKDRSGTVIAISTGDVPGGGAASVGVPDLFPFMRPRAPGGGVTQDIDITFHLKGT